jgi:hypothetical protein
MLTAFALVALLGGATLVAAGLTRLVDGRDRRCLRQVVAQVRVTDAIHGAVGPIVAPTVAERVGKRWTVTMGLGPRDLAAAGSLTEIARQTLEHDGAGCEDRLHTARVRGSLRLPGEGRSLTQPGRSCGVSSWHI